MVAFGDAALGAVLGEAFKQAMDVIKKSIYFDSSLESFRTRVNSLSRPVADIDAFNRQLDRPKEEAEMLKQRVNKGQELLRQCSRIKWWNCCCLRPFYAVKITQMEKSRSFDSDVQAQHLRDTKETLVTVKDMRDKISGVCAKNGFVGTCSVPIVHEKTFGFEVPLKEVRMLLFDDRVDVLMVSAPGGSGKTTLVKMLCHDKDVKDKFGENIFFFTVSKTLNIETIIFKMFERNGCRVPEFQSEEDAVNQLELLLEKIGQKPILLVLDDVWSTSKSVLNKFRFRLPNYKILATSRFVFPEFSSTYHLESLKDEDAMALFRSSAFPEHGKFYMPDETLVQEIVSGCKRLPLALKLIGQSLCGRSAEAWKSLAIEWSQGQSIFNSNSSVLDCLKSSLDFLDSDKKVVAKECFMDLGSFPEDQIIPVTALIDMWVEMYRFDGNGLTAMNNIHELSCRKLLSLITTREDANEVEGCYSKHFVSLHDLLRELAIHQSSLEPIKERKRLFIESGNNSQSLWKEIQQQPANARLLSITTDEMVPNWHDIQVPEVNVLVLNIQTKSFTLPGFVKGMNNLKVVIMTNYGTSDAELTNFEVLCSLPNLKRIRLEHISLPSLTISSVQLKSLQKISLVMCKIGQAFKSSTVAISDLLPNLEEINIDYCYDLVELPEELCNIFSLKMISITNCHKLSALPKNFGNLVNIDELRLHSCTGLLELPDTIGNLQKLSFLDISNCLGIRKLPKEIGNLCSLRKLHMRGCSGFQELPETVLNLSHLKDVICDKETASLWEYFKLHSTNLNVKVPQEDFTLNWLQVSA